jgi:hypothetical protein
MRQTWQEHEENHEAFLAYLAGRLTVHRAVMANRHLGAKVAVLIFTLLSLLAFLIWSAR